MSRTCPYCGYTNCSKQQSSSDMPAFFEDGGNTLTQQDASGWEITLVGCPECKKVFIDY